MSAGVWAEFLTPPELGALLPALAAAGATLCLALPASALGDARLAALTRDATEHGVTVRAWLLLDVEHGYWIGERNAARARQAVERLLAWRAERGGPALGGVSFDLEPDYAFTGELRAARARGVGAWFGMLAARRDAARHAAARHELGRALAEVRRAGLHAHAATYPLLLDQPEGSRCLEEALGIPVSELEWDEISVMVYQTAFAEQAGHWLGPAIVESYARAAVARWGERAGIDLGVVGEPGLHLGPDHRYASPDALEADRRAAERAGVPAARTRLYGLAGMGADPTRWLARRDVAPNGLEDPRAAHGLRNAIGLLCRSLERR